MTADVKKVATKSGNSYHEEGNGQFASKSEAEGVPEKADASSKKKKDKAKYDPHSSKATGKNTFTVRGFMNKAKLNQHWEEAKRVDRRADYEKDGIRSKEDYEKRALELIESEADGKLILGHVDKSGIVVRYDTQKNDFVKGRPDRGVYTMYKPENGINYYLEKLKEDVDHGGRTED